MIHTFHAILSDPISVGEHKIKPNPRKQFFKRIVASVYNLLQSKHRFVNIPNIITVFRLLLTAIFIIAVTIASDWAHMVALIAFIIAAVSDWLDGYLARKMNLVTSLGKLLDPLADKILVSAGFVYLTSIDLCPVWVTCAIIGREFMVTGLRQIAVEKGVVIAADGLGKWKTTFQLIFIIGSLTHVALAHFTAKALSPLQWLAAPSSYVIPTCMWVAVALTIISGANYLWSGRKILGD